MTGEGQATRSAQHPASSRQGSRVRMEGLVPRGLSSPDLVTVTLLHSASRSLELPSSHLPVTVPMASAPVRGLRGDSVVTCPSRFQDCGLPCSLGSVLGPRKAAEFSVSRLFLLRTAVMTSELFTRQSRTRPSRFDSLVRPPSLHRNVS